MFDLLIKGARICDGTGKPSYVSNVAVAGDRIVEVSAASGVAARTIDATGLVLAPGFVDPHTHYDAQVCWDPQLTCSSWHGVTTVLTGNCGVGVAPARLDTRDALLRDLENVEGMPYEVIRAGVRWEWESFGEFLRYLRSRPLSINIAALVSLTPLRHYAMGEASLERAANASELEVMCRELDGALAEGAFGFSTDLLSHHVGFRGRPLACRNASNDELVALARLLKQRDVGAIVVALDSMNGGNALLSDAEAELLRLLVTESGRRLTWLPLLAKPGAPDFHRPTLEKLRALLGRAVPQTSPRPLVFLQTLKNPFVFGFFEHWRGAMNRPVREQQALYASREFRVAAEHEMRTHPRQFDWSYVRVARVGRAELGRYVGRSLSELAAERQASAVSTMLDVALEDDLATLFEVGLSNLDAAGREWLVRRPDVLLGISDGGAHIAQLCDASYATFVLEHWVRERQALSLEEAVRKLTSMPAELFGIPRRGRVAPGWIADLVLFDPDAVGCSPPEFVRDLPLGEERLVSRSRGVLATFVGGRQIWADGALTGVAPGSALHSGEGRPQ